jgi:hypothetical protein
LVYVSAIRWILFSNRPDVVSIPERFRLAQFGGSRQFLVVPTPEAEREFDELKRQFGSIFVLYEAGRARWHSIVWNGLRREPEEPDRRYVIERDYGTKSVTAETGARPRGLFGRRARDRPGGMREGRIRFVRYSAEVPPRTRPIPETRDADRGLSQEEKEARAKFEARMRVVGVCEVAQDPTLWDHGWTLSLENERACVVRIVAVNVENAVDILDNPIRSVPTVRQVLDLEGEEG